MARTEQQFGGSGQDEIRFKRIDDDVRRFTEEPQRLAQLFLHFRRALPPHPDEPGPIDEADADGISQAFRS